MNMISLIEYIEHTFATVLKHPTQLRIFKDEDKPTYRIEFIEKERYLTPAERAIEDSWEKNRWL